MPSTLGVNLNMSSDRQSWVRAEGKRCSFQFEEASSSHGDRQCALDEGHNEDHEPTCGESIPEGMCTKPESVCPAFVNRLAEKAKDSRLYDDEGYPYSIDDIVARHWSAGSREPGHQAKLVDTLEALFVEAGVTSMRLRLKPGQALPERAEAMTVGEALQTFPLGPQVTKPCEDCQEPTKDTDVPNFRPWLCYACQCTRAGRSHKVELNNMAGLMKHLAHSLHEVEKSTKK